MATTYLDTSEGGVVWFAITGHDIGTGEMFSNDVFGVTSDGKILDCDGCPLTEGDCRTVVVRSYLGVIK